ncbi:uncharacterized protein DS421_13g424690 [Arachis hypogaea]|nr:uncharacterized protein DS421_13g424690 [Arachis hypogaea]
MISFKYKLKSNNKNNQLNIKCQRPSLSSIIFIHIHNFITFIYIHNPLPYSTAQKLNSVNHLST